MQEVSMTDSANTTATPGRQLNGAPPKARRKPLRVTRERRARMEAIVESLLALLDEEEGDPDGEADNDREDGGDAEYELGWPEVSSVINVDWHGVGRRELAGVDQTKDRSG